MGLPKGGDYVRDAVSNLGGRLRAMRGAIQLDAVGRASWPALLLARYQVAEGASSLEFM